MLNNEGTTNELRIACWRSTDGHRTRIMEQLSAIMGSAFSIVENVNAFVTMRSSHAEA
jgi:hypothetical protein